MSLIASCMRKKGARTLTAIIRSKNSGFVSQIDPRSVYAAQLASTCRVPKCSSAAAMTRRQASTSITSPWTKTALQPSAFSSLAVASPRSALRPVTTMPAAPRSAKSSAVARPRPWVLPVMTAYLPASEFVSVIDFSSSVGKTGVRVGFRAHDPHPVRPTEPEIPLRPPIVRSAGVGFLRASVQHRARGAAAPGARPAATGLRIATPSGSATPCAPLARAGRGGAANPGRRSPPLHAGAPSGPADPPRPDPARPRPGIQPITRSTGTLRTSISKVRPSTGGRA